MTLLLNESITLKPMEMKRNNIVALLAGVFVLVYLVVDVFHFFIYRIDPVYPTFTEAFYESIAISLIKWIFCVFILVGYLLDKKNMYQSFYLMFLPAIGIILLFVLKGQLPYLIRGSIVFDIGLLELATILLFINSILLIKKYKIKWLWVVLNLVAAIVILGLLFYQLPVYHEPYH